MFISEIFTDDALFAEGYASPPPIKDMITVSGAGEEIKVGDKIRTKKMQMVGKVEKIVADKFNENSDDVFFRVDDGRLMKTPKRNCVNINTEIEEEEEKNQAPVWKPIDTVQKPLGTQYSPKNKYINNPDYNTRAAGK